MRIQILPLPTVYTGDDVEEPFALIVDQFEWPLDESASERWKQFKDRCGARAVLVVPDTVEIVDRYAEPEPRPVTPASAEALKRELDEQQGQLAWLHSGYLNLGYWHDRAVCGGCMATIEHAEDVEAHFRLVPIEAANVPKTIEPAAPIPVLRTDGETAFEFHGERWRIVASNFRHNDLGGESELTLRIVPDERPDDDAITDQGVIDVDPAPLISYYEARRHR